MDTTPNKISSENLDAEKTTKWDELYEQRTQELLKENLGEDTPENPVSESRLDEILNRYQNSAKQEVKEEPKTEGDLIWKDSAKSAPLTGSAEENRLDNLLKQYSVEPIEQMPDKPVEFKSESEQESTTNEFEPIPEEDLKIMGIEKNSDPSAEALSDDGDLKWSEPSEPIEPIPLEDLNLPDDELKKDSANLPPADEIEAARRHREIELSQLEHQNTAIQQEKNNNLEQAMRKPLIIINTADKIDQQAIKQENLVPIDRELTESVEYAIKKYAEYELLLSLQGKKSTKIDACFKRDMEKVVQKAIEDGRVNSDIENTNYLDNYLDAAKQVADRFIEAQKEVKNGKEREAVLDSMMEGFQIYEVKPSSDDTEGEPEPTDEPETTKPESHDEPRIKIVSTGSSYGQPRTITIPASRINNHNAKPVASETNKFEEWNTELLKEIKEMKDLVDGEEGIYILTNSEPLSPSASRQFSVWWDRLTEKGKDAVIYLIDKIESSEYHNEIKWGNSFHTWFNARVRKNLEPKNPEPENT